MKLFNYTPSQSSSFLLLLVLLSIILLNAMSCSSKKDTQPDNLSTVEMRQNVSKSSPITFSEEIKRVEYIPLELTDDKRSAISNVFDISVTDDYIFIYAGYGAGIFQFSRIDGKFIRNFAQRGGGPGETQLIFCFYVDEIASKVYIVQAFPHKVLEYMFDGSFVGAHEQKRNISLQYPLGNNLIAVVGRERWPFSDPELIGMGVFNINGDTIAIKNDFARPDILPADASCIKDVRSALSYKSVLYHIASNDTVFRLSHDGIQPAFVFDRQNSREFLEGALNPKINDLFPNNFTVWDFFETSKSFYVRAMIDHKMYIFALDKATNQTTSEISNIDPREIFGYDRWMQGIGIRIGDGKIPFWPTKSFLEKNILVQYLPAPEIFYLKEKGVINQLPKEIDFIDEFSNPVVIIYHI